MWAGAEEEVCGAAASGANAVPPNDPMPPNSPCMAPRAALHGSSAEPALPGGGNVPASAPAFPVAAPAPASPARVELVPPPLPWPACDAALAGKSAAASALPARWLAASWEAWGAWNVGLGLRV